MSDVARPEPQPLSSNVRPIRSTTELAVALRRLLLAHERTAGKPVKKAALAKTLGVSASSLYAYLNGATLPPTDVFDRLLELLAVAPSERRRLAAARDEVAIARKHGGEPEQAAAQLPHDVGVFTGRTSELDRLHDLLETTACGPVVVSAIDGMGGIGKSALAIHAAHQLKARFPDGQLYVNLHGASPGLSPVPPAEVLARFLAVFGIDASNLPSNIDEAAARFRSLLDGRRMLVVLDNAASAAQVRPLLPGSSGCAVIVTSRRVLATLDGATHLRLDVLREDEALTLLARLTGDQRIAADPDAAARIVQRCGCVPLALRIAAARLADRPSWSVNILAERLSNAHSLLDELQRDDMAVRLSFGVSYHDLQATSDGQQAARLFRLLGLHPGPDIGVLAAAAMTAHSTGYAESLLESLVDNHLLESPYPGRYQMHDLLRSYAAERAESEETPDERTAAIHRAITWYLHIADAIDRLVAPGRDHVPLQRDYSYQPQSLNSLAEAVRWYQTEHQNFVAVTRRAAELDMHDLAWQIPVAISRIAHEQCATRADLITLGRIAAESAHRIDDQYGEGRALTALGSTCAERGQFDEAIEYYQQALAIHRRIGYRSGEQLALNNLGGCHQYLCDLGTAVEYYLVALDMAVEINDNHGQAITLTSLGEACHGLGRFDEAISYFTRALSILTACDYRNLEASTLGYLARTYATVNRFADALSCCDQSLEMHRSIGSRRGEAETLITLTEIHRRRSQPDTARLHRNRALSILDELGSPSTDRLRTRLTATD